jgi:hypothetical protein
MCVAGGKRCEYADSIANVRKKTRSKLKNSYNIERGVVDAVEKFKEQNPALVLAHLPEKMAFQYQPPQRPVPEHIKGLLTPYAAPALGSAENQDVLFGQLHERGREWRDGLTRQEDDTVHDYTLNAYESMNTYLRRHGFQDWAKQNRHLWSSYGEGQQDYVENMIKPRIAEMDAALKKAPAPEEPEKLYRFFRVPSGVTPAQYIRKYFTPGAGFKDRGFLSTTADPEYVAAHIMSRSGGTRNKHYVVMEILSSRGASLQPRPEGDPGWVQSLEAEIVLPRNAGLHIVDSGKRHFEFGKDRPDLAQRYNMFGGRSVDLKEGTSISLPVIRMVDTALTVKGK